MLFRRKKQKEVWGKERDAFIERMDRDMEAWRRIGEISDTLSAELVSPLWEAAAKLQDQGVDLDGCYVIANGEDFKRWNELGRERDAALPHNATDDRFAGLPTCLSVVLKTGEWLTIRNGGDDIASGTLAFVDMNNIRIQT